MQWWSKTTSQFGSFLCSLYANIGASNNWQRILPPVIGLETNRESCCG